MNTEQLTGTKSILSLVFKRDKIRLLIWMVSIFLLTYSLIIAFKEAITSEDEMRSMIQHFATNPSMRALLAPASGALDVGSFFMLRTSTTVVVIISVFNIQTIVRHTRQNEETGLAEMIASTSVGRFAILTSVLIFVVISNILILLLLVFAFVINGLPLIGSLNAALALCSVGFLFALIAAISAQIYQSTRGTSGFAYIGLGIAFMISSIGNIFAEVSADGLQVYSHWIVWLSPFGWYQQMFAFSQNIFWILSIFVVTYAVLITITLVLNNNRDLGLGMFAVRKGASVAPKYVKNPIGLALRLQKNIFISWAIPLFVLSLLFGSISNQFAETLSDIEGIEHIFAGLEGNEAFLGFIVINGASFAAFYAVQTIMKMRSEEANGYLEPILATPVSRLRWQLSHILCSVIGLLVMLFMIGFLAGVASVGEEGARTSKIIEASVMLAPAILIVAGLTYLGFSLLPNYTVIIGYTIVCLSLILGPFFGPMFNFPDWLLNISPYTHATTSFELLPFLIKTIISVILFISSVALFQKRNLVLHG